MARRRLEFMRLDQIQAASRNPKRHDTDGIRSALAEFGLGDLPVLDERTERLVSGHGRVNQLTAMRGAGDPPPDGVEVDADGAWLVPVVRGWQSRSDGHGEAYLLAANQLTVNGGWDDGELRDLLVDAQDRGLLNLTGFNDDDLARLLHADDPPIPMGDDDEPGAAGWGVVVTVATAAAQEELVRQLTAQGHSVRTLAAWKSDQ